MTARNKLIRTTMASMLALGTVGLTTQAMAADDKERCYGVAKAAKNDCAANGHACAAQSKVDGDPTEYLYVPKGTCERLVGGSTTANKG